MRVLSTIGLLTVVAAIQAQEPIKLTPGMAAPKLEVGGWAKYEAPKPGRFRVVEFWATWCGPCIQTIPHLTELAKKHKDKVDFVGVSVFESGNDDAVKIAKVKKFVTDFGDKMDYRVAYDTPTGTMGQTWMNAAEQPGIPTAFIVNEKNEIVWVGHPMAMDKPLEDAVAGKLDVAAIKAKFIQEVNGRRESQKTQREITAAVKQYNEGKTAEAEAALDAIAKRSPDTAQTVKLQRLMVMYKPGTPESDKLVEQMLTEGGDAHQYVAQFGMRLLSTNGVTDGKGKAKKIADRIAANEKDAVIQYFAGMLYSRLGDKAAAVKAFDTAVVAAENDANVKGNAAFLEAVKKQKEAINTPPPVATGGGR